MAPQKTTREMKSISLCYAYETCKANTVKSVIEIPSPRRHPIPIQLAEPLPC